MKTALDKLRARLPAAGSLSQRLISASAWAASGEAGLAVIRLGSNLITTRLLFPEAFGLIAIVVTIQALCTMLTDLGISRSIIRDPDGEDPEYLRAAWTLQAIVFLLISGVMVLIAGVVWWLGPDFAAPGTVFADPILPGLILFCALTPLVSLWTTPAQFVAQRQLKQKRIVQFNLLAQVLGTGITIVVLYFIPSVWVLAFGIVLNATTRMALSHVYFPYEGLRLRPSFDWSFFRKQWDFGKYLVVSSLLYFFFRQGDRLVLGAFLDARTFGFYVIAMVWIEAANTAATKILNSPGYAALSEIVRDRPERLPSAYRKYGIVLTALNLSAAAGLCFVGPLMIDLLYTSEYGPVGDFLTVLSLIFLFTRYQAVGVVKLAQGDSRATMYLSAMRAAGMLLLPPLGYALGGVLGATMGVVLAGACSLPLMLWYISQFMSSRYMRSEYLLLAATGAAVLAMVVYAPLS